MAFEKASQRFYTESREIVEKLQSICDHADTVPFIWDWDSGYGRQSKNTGKRCVYCSKVDYWNRGDFNKESHD